LAVFGSVGVAALAIALATVVPAHAAERAQRARTLTEESTAGKCLEANTSTSVRMARCSGVTRQQWGPRFVSGSELESVQRPGLARDHDSYVRFVNRRTGQCLALVDGAGTVGER
jgi:hypothetical protein